MRHTRRAKTAPRRDCFEYIYVEDRFASETIKHLDRLGKSGWEFTGTSGNVIWLKRKCIEG